MATLRRAHTARRSYYIAELRLAPAIRARPGAAFLSLTGDGCRRPADVPLTMHRREDASIVRHFFS